MGIFSCRKENAFEQIELIYFVCIKSGMKVPNKAVWESGVPLVLVQLHKQIHLKMCEWSTSLSILLKIQI